MPTNLPPEYYNIEERLRSAKTKEEKLAHLEELLSIVPKHKGTDKLRADLRKRLSKLKDSVKSQKKSHKQVSVYRIPKEGAGQAVLLGPANTGKSSLLKVMTKAEPEVANFPFTTSGPSPGMMNFENIKIQLIDTPPIHPEYIDPEMVNLLRRTDLLIWVIDLQGPTFDQLEEIQKILKKNKIIPDQWVDASSEAKNWSSVPIMVAVNKVDDEKFDEDFNALKELLAEDWPLSPVSTKTGRNLEVFQRDIYKGLGIIRVYSKVPGKPADLEEPFVLPQGSTIKDFAVKLHRDFAAKLKSARIWGTGVYDGQMVGLDHVLHEEDVVELKT